MHILAQTRNTRTTTTNDLRDFYFVWEVACHVMNLLFVIWEGMVRVWDLFSSGTSFSCPKTPEMDFSLFNIFIASRERGRRSRGGEGRGWSPHLLYPPLFQKFGIGTARTDVSAPPTVLDHTSRCFCREPSALA